MVVNTSIVINGSVIDSFNTCSVTKSLGNEYASNEFSANIDNWGGRNGSKFEIGDSVAIYIEKDYDIISESLRNNIIGYWKLDENITWVSNLGIEYSNPTPVGDSTGNFEDGIITDNAFVSLQGKINNCLGFDKTTEALVTIPVNSGNVKQNPDEFSFSFWAKFDTVDTVSDIISTTFTSGTGDYNWVFGKNTDTGASTMAFGITDSNTEVLNEVGVGSVSNNNWNHYVGTYTGSPGFSKFYINSVLTGSLATTKKTDINNLIFGDVIPSTGNAYLDEISLFNNELTTSQISTLYNNGNGLSYGKHIFDGLVEDVKYTGKETKEEIQLTGRDWTLALQDRTVEPEVYTNTTAGSIVKDIILKYTDGISTSGVQPTPQIIDRISFNHTPVFDAVKQLADYSQFIFYVDENKDLKFQERKVIDSLYVYDNTGANISTKVTFKDQRDTLFNQIWVYGDRYLDGYKETFTATGGSVFNLTYNPHNTSITTNGSIVQPGAIQGITSSPGSAIKYMVSYDDKQIVFVSGTQQGNNIPGTGSSVVVTYDRSLPIIKVGDNESSKAQYGTRVKVIQDKNIKDPDTAELIMLQNLDDYSDPQKEGTLNINGIDDVNVGQSVLVNNTYHNIVWQPYEIVEMNYDLNKSNCLGDNVMSIKLNKKLPDITDKLKEVILEIKKLQAQDMTISDNLTRFQYTTGSEGIRQSGLNVWTIEIGSSFILSHPVNGLLGSYTSHTLGDWKTGSTLSWSGGYF